MDRKTGGVDFARRITEAARHPFGWYRRTALIGRVAAVLCLLCSLAAAAYDLWPGRGTGAEGDVLFGAVPGNMTARLCFRLIRNTADMTGDRRFFLLAEAVGAVILSLEILLIARVFRDRTMLGIALLLFADTLVSWTALCFPVTAGLIAGGSSLLTVVAGTILRTGLGIVLLRGHIGELWQHWLFAAEEILWVADRYGWSDSFDPSTLSSEEWRVIHRAYFEYLCEEEKEEEEP